jgi:L-asparaginase / beta-aspartyl-peptidase
MYTLTIHGGAGTILRSKMTPERNAAYANGMHNALKSGEKILAAGGSALDAVCLTVSLLEDNPLFNAGRGSVFNNAGGHEMDASLMDGSNLAAGAVTCVSWVKNPVRLARLVMEKTEHILLAGKGAEELAKLHNSPI